MSFTRPEIYFEAVRQVASSEHLVTNYNFYSLEMLNMWIIDKSSRVCVSSIHIFLLESELSLYTNNLTQRIICKMHK
jgi:hypothetical protein